jgi:menaquinone-dependent protoporphyrinogen oxidase
MSGKILIAYASRTGTTAGVADAVGKALADKGSEVDILPMKSVTDLKPYWAVVAGSAIQASKWLPEAMEFLMKHREELKTKRFAIFTVCMTLAMPNAEKYRQVVLQWLEPVRATVRPESEALFAGKLDLNEIQSIGDRLKFRISILMGVWKAGDHRDWKAIRKWGEELANLFK